MTGTFLALFTLINYVFNAALRKNSLVQHILANVHEIVFGDMQFLCSVNDLYNVTNE